MGARSITAAAAALMIACSWSTARAGGASVRPACEGPPAKGMRWAWPKSTRVVVLISPELSSLTGARQAIESAFRNWEAASGPDGNGRGVTFALAPSETPSPGSATFQVRTGEIKGSGQAQTLLMSRPGGLASAVCTIDPRVTDPAALANVMAHEIGHTFGLAECDDCAPGSSAMTRYSGEYNDTANGRNGPSACDNEAVRGLEEP